MCQECQECQFVTVSPNSPLFQAVLDAELVAIPQAHVTEYCVTANLCNKEVRSFTIERPGYVGTAEISDIPLEMYQHINDSVNPDLPPTPRYYDHLTWGEGEWKAQGQTYLRTSRPGTSAGGENLNMTAGTLEELVEKLALYMDTPQKYDDFSMRMPVEIMHLTIESGNFSFHKWSLRKTKQAEVYEELRNAVEQAKAVTQISQKHKHALLKAECAWLTRSMLAA